MADINSQVHGTQRIPSKKYKNSTPIHNILKLQKAKDREKIFKESRERKYLTSREKKRGRERKNSNGHLIVRNHASKIMG